MTSAFLSLKPVSEPTDFIGRQKEILWLCRLIGGDRAECCSMVGMSKMGKTSLLAYLVHPEGAKADLRPLVTRSLWARRFVERTELAVVPMQSIAEWSTTEMQAAVAQALYNISQPVRRGGTPLSTNGDRWRGMSPPQLADECERMLAQFVERSPYPDARVAIAFDDADILLDESEPELRGSLRHLATGTMSDHLSFVMTTSDPLALHSEHGDVSSFTNIFHEEYLGLLTPDESRELIERATESLRPNRALLGGPEEDDGARDYDEDESEVTLDEDDAEFLLAHAGRHPDILKVGCRYLLDSKRRGPELQRQLRLLGDANRRTRAFSPEGGAGLAAAKIPERTQMLHAIVARRLRTDGHVRGVYDAIAARLLEELPLYQAAVSIARNNQRPRHERDELDLGAVDWLTIGDLVRIGIVDDTGDRYRLFSTSFEEHLLRRAAPGDRYRLFSTSLEEHLLRRAAPAEGEQSREPEVSELRYIPGRREVAVGDRRLKLTPLESRLMGQLWDNADHICDKSDLLEEIWGPGTSEAVLEKAVNRLRTKINRESEGVDYIMTVRGVGYMLQPHP